MNPVATPARAAHRVATHDTAEAWTAAADPSAAELAPILSLEGAAVRAARGTVFGPLSAESRSAVTVVLGDRGSGRTSLLLCLGGRMRLSDGSLRVLGEQKAGRIRRRTGIAGFEAIDALEPGVTVADILRERLAWASPWYRRIPRITPELGDELLAPVFGTAHRASSTGVGTGADASAPAPAAIPHPDTLVRELSPAQDLLLRASLALIEAPELLLLDDFDALRNPAERAHVAHRLAALAATGLRIVLATSDPGDAQLLADALASAGPLPGDHAGTDAGTEPAVIRL